MITADDIKDEFSVNLASIRRLRRLSNRELAKAIGLNDHVIYHYEDGKMLTSTLSLVRLCDALKVTPNELLGF